MPHRPPSVLRLERRRDPPADIQRFGQRLLAGAGMAGSLILFSLLLGVLGYRYIAGLPDWVDCIYNASMILGGMGPVAEIKTDAGKLFASAYALYSGVVLLTSVSIVLGPVFHRVLHRFHWDDENVP